MKSHATSASAQRSDGAHETQRMGDGGIGVRGDRMRPLSRTRP
jgi:hypothetical protein